VLTPGFWRLSFHAGHQHLFELGILHRDISAGNILLSAGVEPEEGCEGFLMDLEFAHVSSPSLNDINIIRVAPLRHPSGHLTNATTRTHIKFDKVAVQHGAAMTVKASYNCALLFLIPDYSLRGLLNSWPLKF
jgi:hypothetical protein